MRLNVGTDYGLPIVMCLLVHPGTRVQIDAMAQTFDVSSNHLTKVVQRLSRAGFVKTYRGRSGGVMLARQPGDIDLGDVIRSLETGFAMVECLLESGSTCCLSPTCRLRDPVREALEAFIGTFSKYTLIDLDAPDLRRLLAMSCAPDAARRPAEGDNRAHRSD